MVIFQCSTQYCGCNAKRLSQLFFAHSCGNQSPCGLNNNVINWFAVLVFSCWFCSRNTNALTFQNLFHEHPNDSLLKRLNSFKNLWGFPSKSQSSERCQLTGTGVIIDEIERRTGTRIENRGPDKPMGAVWKVDQAPFLLEVFDCLRHIAQKVLNN